MLVIRCTNVATDLVNEVVSVLQKNNRDICVLSVKNENTRGFSFYKKLALTVIRGFNPVHKYIKWMNSILNYNRLVRKS